MCLEHHFWGFYSGQQLQLRYQYFPTPTGQGMHRIGGAMVGILCSYGENLVSWQSKKQARSSTEAEYKSLADASRRQFGLSNY